METKITLYVIRCKTRDHYYVGTTLRPLCMRIREHEVENAGSLWTRIHGFDRVEEAYVVPNHRASQIENDVTIEYMRRYGYRKVRGGDYTYSKNDGSTWWLPLEFREIAQRDNMSISTHSDAASERSVPSQSAGPPPSRFLRRRRSSSVRV